MEVVAMSIEGKLPLLSNIYLISTSDACVGATFLTTHQEKAGLRLLQRYELGRKLYQHNATVPQPLLFRDGRGDHLAFPPDVS